MSDPTDLLVLMIIVCLGIAILAGVLGLYILGVKELWAVIGGLL